ncbi:hypothetical protein H1R20_g5577, partial [Candolleomyces eurysporus]
MRKREPGSVTPVTSRVFFWAVILMFLTATFHEFITTYRLLRAYGWILGPLGTPISYYRQNLYWDNHAHSAMIGIMIWLGDALVIYRCYIIWGQKLYVIAVPLLLLLVKMGFNITLDVWFGNTFTSYENILPIIEAVYPINFAQNVLTTGLIAYKIFRQHRTSKSIGLTVSHRISLIQVMRIIVESALLYTFELMLLIILSFSKSPVQYVVQAAIIPSVGEYPSFRIDHLPVFCLYFHLVTRHRVLAHRTPSAHGTRPTRGSHHQLDRPPYVAQWQERNGIPTNRYDLSQCGIIHHI